MENESTSERKEQLDHEYEVTGNLAIAIVEHAFRCIGPKGTVMQLPEESSRVMREAYIKGLADTALMILNEDPRSKD